MNKLWSDEAWSDYVHWQSQDKKTVKKINNLLKEKSTD
ncbi:MAG: Txe/YoeB family addiction module toxin [Clostridia bacterium]|nr:Txe/YoeB family addiction module toxin [Clostridia bacterium]